MPLLASSSSNSSALHSLRHLVLGWDAGSQLRGHSTHQPLLQALSVAHPSSRKSKNPNLSTRTQNVPQLGAPPPQLHPTHTTKREKTKQNNATVPARTCSPNVQLANQNPGWNQTPALSPSRMDKERASISLAWQGQENKNCKRFRPSGAPRPRTSLTRLLAAWKRNNYKNAATPTL